MPTLRARIPLATLVSELDLDVHPAGHVEPHQGVDHLGVGVEDVEDALVGAMKGPRTTVYLLMVVGSGTGPATRVPVRVAVSTIFEAAWSRTLWSYALRRMRIF